MWGRASLALGIHYSYDSGREGNRVVSVFRHARANYHYVKGGFPRYAEIAVPVSILAGDSDLIVSEKENAERLHEALPRSRLIVLPKTGHQIPFTHPQSVIDEIERVQRLSRARG